MAQITLRGNAINTVGELPAIGSPAPGFTLTGTDLGQVSADQFRDKPLLLNIFPPSVDTPVCAASVRTFNERAAAEGISVLCVSKDLPFAQKRFCGAEGIENVTSRRRSGTASATTTASRSSTDRWPGCWAAPWW